MATKKKACPKCGIVGSIDKLFGYRKLRWDVIVPQSWCTKCRTNKGRPPKPDLVSTKKIKATGTFGVVKPPALQAFSVDADYVKIFEIISDGARAEKIEAIKILYAHEYPNDKTPRGIPAKLEKLKRKRVLDQNVTI